MKKRKHRRLFISISLPEEIKKDLFSFQQKHQDLPVRWVSPENLHITLTFLGNIPDLYIDQIQEALQQTCSNIDSFKITLEKILPGPSSFNPRMIWVQTAENERLQSLKKEIDCSLFAIKGLKIFPQRSFFKPHITLARFKNRNLPYDNFTFSRDLQKELNSSFWANSVNLMESILSREGAKYFQIKKAALRNTRN